MTVLGTPAEGVSPTGTWGWASSALYVFFCSAFLQHFVSVLRVHGDSNAGTGLSLEFPFDGKRPQVVRSDMSFSLVWRPDETTALEGYVVNLHTPMTIFQHRLFAL